MSLEGSLHILTIGVSYQHRPDRVEELHFTRNDATELAAVLAGHMGPYNKAKPRTLLDGEATKEAIMVALRDLRRDVKAAKGSNKVPLAIVAFSGHGDIDKDLPGKRFVFLAHDYDRNKIDTTTVSEQDLRDLLGGMGCPVILLMDCCHAGFSVNKGGKGPSTPPPVKDALEELQKIDGGVVLLAACRKDQVAKEDEKWKHGALTYAFLQSLKSSGHRDSILYLNKVADRTEEELGRLVGKDQSFWISTSDGLSLTQIPIAYVSKSP
jgi:uncharacterized caspase-like protein